MRKRSVTAAIVALFLAGAAGALQVRAQDNGKTNEAPIKPADSYRVEFAVNEMENGKKVNSRSYTVLVRAEPAPKWSDRKILRVGSKVPISTGGESFQYQDVGMNIDCRLMPMENGNVSIDANLEYSTLASEQEARRPIFRVVRTGGGAVVPLGKSTVISEMDDVASTHRYVFEVKVTKVS